MIKDQEIAQELKAEFAQGNFKPSQLKRSRSTGDISSSPNSTPLKKSQSTAEMSTLPLTDPHEQIIQLQDQIKFHAQTSQNYLQSLQLAQAKVSELEDKLTQEKRINNELQEKILELRLKNLQDFDEYYNEKKALKGELEENINEGTKEIERLEKQLLNLNRKKLEMQEQLKQSELKNTRLELRGIDCESQKINWPRINWPLWLGLAGVVVFLSWKGEKDDL